MSFRGFILPIICQNRQFWPKSLHIWYILESKIQEYYRILAQKFKLDDLPDFVKIRLLSQCVLVGNKASFSCSSFFILCCQLQGGQLSAAVRGAPVDFLNEAKVGMTSSTLCQDGKTSKVISVIVGCKADLEMRSSCSSSEQNHVDFPKGKQTKT